MFHTSHYSKFHSLTSSGICFFSSLSALLKPARSPLPSQKHTCYKVSPSQHRFTEPNLSYSSLDIFMPFLFTISLKFPQSSVTSFLPFLDRLFFRMSFYLFSPALELSKRSVPATRLPIPCPLLNHSFIFVLDTSS